MKSPYILIAEDDEDDRLLLDDAFEDIEFPHETVYVTDGQDLINFLHKIDEHNKVATQALPSLILLDLNMPKKDGRETLRELKSHDRWHTIPVVVFTTSNAHTDVFLTYEFGANSYVIKPDSYAALRHHLHILTEYWFSVVRLP